MSLGIRYHGVKPLDRVGDIPVFLDGDRLYLADSEKYSLEKNIQRIHQLISLLNRTSTTPYTFEDIVSLPCSERVDHHYGARDNEFSSYLEALAQGRQSWRGKFFIIRDNFLMYFRDQASRKPEGVIPLEGATIQVLSLIHI